MHNTERNTGFFFSSAALRRFLETNGLSHVIRAHQTSQSGFKVLLECVLYSHSSLILTTHIIAYRCIRRVAYWRCFLQAPTAAAQTPRLASWWPNERFVASDSTPPVPPAPLQWRSCSSHAVATLPPSTFRTLRLLCLSLPTLLL